MTARVRSPLWVRAVAVVLLLWGLLGCWACLQQLRLGADAMGPASAYDRQLYASLPVWYNPTYVVAVLSGALGAAALLAGSRLAVPIAGVALATVVIMFGWMFAATDLIAHKGFAVAATFPIVVALIALAQLWLSVVARRRGWIG